MIILKHYGTLILVAGLLSILLILPSQPQPPPSGLPYTDRSRLYDASGQQLFLKSINCDRNERRSGSSLSQYWSEADVKRIRDSGGNCVEIHVELLSHWMPTKNQIDESYFVDTLDKEVFWCEKYGIYYIINLQGFRSKEDYMRNRDFLPEWMYEGYYSFSYPLSESQANQVILDFMNTDNPKLEEVRQAWYNAWKFVANRYKNNKHFFMGLLNEQGIHITYPDTATRQVIGRTYYTLMARTVDSIRSVGAEHVIFIDHVRVGSFSYHVNDYQPNTVLEAHCYITTGTSLSEFKSNVDNYVSHYYTQFNMPLYFGEYGFYSPPKPSDWKNLLQQEVAYLNTKPIVGRQWHCWSHLNGEQRSIYTASETQQVLQIILGGGTATIWSNEVTANAYESVM